MLLFSSDRHDRGSGFLFFVRVKRRGHVRRREFWKKDAGQKEKSKKQGEDIAKELKFAAEYSADEMKDSWKHAGEAVRHAANEIKEDMSEMKESAQAVFEDAAEE